MEEKNQEQEETKALQVAPENSVEAVKVTKATLDVVRRTIFPTANDDELALFVHKCIAAGCHPLDGMIHPSKFKDKNTGQYRVVFISSIDYFRSSAEDTGMYDGQDEPEFEWDNDENDKHPISCKISVWKKGISRPFVGIADWDEFYPAIKNKQFMYDKMPKVMISKCAEAQAFRKAFPKSLNKLYVEEEMYQASSNPGNGGNSTKPEITQKTEPTTHATQKTTKPISEGQVKRIYGMCKGNNVNVEKLKLWLKESKGIESLKDITWENSEYDTICEAIEKKSESINNYVSKATKPPVETAPPEEVLPETAMDHEDFKKHVMDIAEKAKVEDINFILGLEFSFNTLDEVPADMQEKVIEHFVNMGKEKKK